MPAAVLGDGDPLAPIFFLSYHRGEGSDLAEARDTDEFVLRLFNDLIDQLNPLVARRPGAEYGFIDRGMRGGDRWAPSLMDALGRCQVFVALTSAPYFESEFCGKEWHGFSGRAIVRSNQGTMRFDSAIIPVVWAPNYSGWVPKVADRIQRFTPGPGFPEPQYLERGVHGLLATSKEEAYKEVVWRLARRIANTFYACRVESRELDDRKLRNVFQEEVP
ncbi:MAG TPA: TIR-like protein FxsC [Actinocrinis sp.]|jgi:hypothetical protein|uniref:TIR-like protein FxsC n=1 Tax=Actinocrinis sp. TaxID=1920516 RepID=UPI002DDD0EB6|nr:TIR-like protein FxsC [Actinocrinis sp.]HEV3169187.1 TIR-like protein FxsC [Actinocrinis sp.]